VGCIKEKVREQLQRGGLYQGESKRAVAERWAVSRRKEERQLQRGRLYQGGRKKFQGEREGVAER
jgi:hypothetical protein